MSLVRREPVLMVGTGLNTLIAMYFAFFPGIHLTAGQLAAVSTIATAITALVAAFLTKPANLGVINASLSTILVAAAAFGLHLDKGQIALVTSAVVAVLGYLLREKVSPVVGTRL